jgi:hypothetical protein
LTPLELIVRIAALVPPPRTHRHRYFWVLAPNSPLRDAVTALAAPAQALSFPVQLQPAQAAVDESSPIQCVPPMRSPAHCLCAVLIARISEVLRLLRPVCGGQMRLIAFITHSADIRQILDHIGVDSQPPHITPARGPPLWDDCGDAQMGESVEVEPGWDMTAQPALA